MLTPSSLVKYLLFILLVIVYTVGPGSSNASSAHDVDVKPKSNASTPNLPTLNEPKLITAVAQLVHQQESNSPKDAPPPKIVTNSNSRDTPPPLPAPALPIPSAVPINYNEQPPPPAILESKIEPAEGKTELSKPLISSSKPTRKPDEFMHVENMPKSSNDFPMSSNVSDDEDEASSYISSPLCVSLHPGFEMITRGIDISKLDLTEKFDDIGTVGKIFDLSCNLGDKAQSMKPVGEGGQGGTEYTLPDHFTMVPMTATYTQPMASIVHSINQLREDLTFNLDKTTSEDLPRGAFLETEKYRQFEELITNQSKYLTVYRVSYSTFSITTNAPKEVLSRRFKSAYNRLPSFYQSDPTAVQNFVKSYGTHYLERVIFGGEIMFISKINNAIRELMSERKLLNLMTSLYKKQLNDKTAPTTLSQFSTEEIDLIARNSETIAFFMGGNHTLVSKQINFNEWRDSLTSKSHPIYITVKPIIDLLPEGSKKDAVREAIDIYLGKLYMEDLQRILNSEVYQLNTLSADANYFNFKVQKELERPNLDPKSIHLLGAEIERWAFTPKWFFNNVQLMMKVTSYAPNECSMSETLINVNRRSPVLENERLCATYIKGLEFRLKSNGYTEYGFNPAHIIIAPKINPYQIHFRLSPLSYKMSRVPGWIRLLRFCTYGLRLIRCIKLDETSYYGRSYENFQIALKTAL